MEVGDPYNVVFSNKYLESHYLKKGVVGETMVEEIAKTMRKKKYKISKHVIERLKVCFVCVAGFIVFFGYISLMAFGAFVCTLIL